MTATVLERFEAKFIPEPMSGCWLWSSPLRPDGYGRFWVHRAPALAHVVSYKLYRGEVPTGLLVRHRCDVTYCVNPDHLEVGTQYDNMRDCVDRGRNFNATKTHCQRDHAYTEENTYTTKSGKRQCRACGRIKDAVRRASTSA